MLYLTTRCMITSATTTQYESDGDSLTNEVPTTHDDRLFARQCWLCRAVFWYDNMRIRELPSQFPPGVLIACRAQCGA
eukprot:5994-Eustigmatos_ZCMA.PRE.1